MNIIKNMKFLSNLLVIILFLGSMPVYSIDKCIPLFEKTSFWRSDESQNLYDNYRANVPHFIRWIIGEKDILLQINPHLWDQGVVAVDPSVGNIGLFFLKNQNWKLKLIDMDDSGKGPFIADLQRQWIAIKSSKASVSSRQIWESYIDGLNGKTQDVPHFLEKYFNASETDFLNEQQNEIKKVIKKEKLLLKDLGLKPLNEGSSQKQKLAQELTQKLRQNFPEAEILDGGWKIPLDGGSQGLVRFWFLLKTKNGYEIKEFKEQGLPGSELFGRQGTQHFRIKRVKQNIWKITDTDEYVTVSTSGGSYLMRSRFNNPLEDLVKQLLKDGGKELDQLSLFVTNYLGLIHGSQKSSQNYKAAMNAQAGEIFEKLKQLKDKYLALMKTNILENSPQK